MSEFVTKIDEIFENYCIYLKKNNIKVVMPTFYPQRGEILEEMQKRGVECCILGGKDGVRSFKTVEQYGLDKDTTGMAETDEEQDMLVARLPEKFQNSKLVVHGYEQYNWAEKIQKRFPKTEIISQTAQNTYCFFEEKTNLKAILEEAGLREHFIPSEVFKVADIIANGDYKKIYEEFRNQKNGKIVVQICGEDHHEAGGGKSTYIIDSEEDFAKTMQNIGKGTVKIARFIVGAESNLSFFCSNSELTETGTVKKHNISLDSESDFYKQSETLGKLKKTQYATDASLYAIVGKATAKCVGCDLLTSSPGNGVGNDVGYIFEDGLRTKIKEIGEKLGKLMAKCGKSGLAGCDLIITADGEIFINEINDRQQGPTEQMSKDAESNNILSIMKLAFLTSHYTFSREESSSLLIPIREQASQISDAYLTNTGNFYIKLNSTHSEELGLNFQFAHNIEKGIYKLERDSTSSKWTMKLVPETSPELKPINIDSDETIYIKIDGATKKGNNLEPQKQMLRIEGNAKEGSAPFLIKDGRTILNPKWEPIISLIYDTIVKGVEGSKIANCDSYQDFNPLLQKKLLEEREESFKNNPLRSR